MATSNIPGGSVYAQAVALAKQRYQTRLADLNRQRQGTLRTAGFLGDINPDTGLIQNQRTDPYNPYGAYQQLNRSQAARGYEQLGQNIARGLGTGGGLAAQSMGEQRFGWGKEDAEFGANLADQLAGYTRQQAEEKYNYDEALWQAQQAAAQAAIAAGDYGAGGGGEGDYGQEQDYSNYSDPNDPYGVGEVSAILGGLPPGFKGITPGAIKKSIRGAGRGGGGRGGGRGGAQTVRAQPKIYRGGSAPVPKRPAVKKPPRGRGVPRGA